MRRFTRPAFLSAIAIASGLVFAGTGRAQSPNPHVGNWKGNIATLTRVDANTSRSVYKNHGTVTVTQTAAVSADGKTRTVTAKGKNVLGQTLDNVTVYDRQ